MPLFLSSTRPHETRRRPGQACWVGAGGYSKGKGGGEAESAALLERLSAPLLPDGAYIWTSTRSLPCLAYMHVACVCPESELVHGPGLVEGRSVSQLVSFSSLREQASLFLLLSFCMSLLCDALAAFIAAWALLVR